MTHPSPVRQHIADFTPVRLRKLMLRLAQLAPGMIYMIALTVTDEQSEPEWSVLASGRIENTCNAKRSVVG
jgi:hypothetical protein